MDCGPACLRMVAKFYGKEIPAEALKQITSYSKTGVSLLGMADAAEFVGFKAFGVKLTAGELMGSNNFPCILHWRQNHFVVLVGFKKRFWRVGYSVVIADPAQGMVTLTMHEFEQLWGMPMGIGLFLQPGATFQEKKDEYLYVNRDKVVGWRHILTYLSQYRKQVVQVVVSLMIGSVFPLFLPFLTQSIVDTGINTHNLSYIQVILVAYFVLLLSRRIVDFLRSKILLYVSAHINLSLLSDFWMKLMRLPLSYFETRHVGDILQRLNDQRRIETFVTGTALQTFFSFLSLLFFSVALIIYYPAIFFLFAVSSVLYVLWIMVVLRWRRALDYRRFSIAAKENSITMQLINGMQEIKLNNAEKSKRWEWEGAQAELFRLHYKDLSVNQYQQLGAFLFTEGKDILITYLVARSVMEGSLTLGAMLAIQYITGQLSAPVEDLLDFSRQLQEAKISLERLNDIHSIKEEPGGDVLRTFDLAASEVPAITFNNVSFTYPGAGNEPVLKNVHLRFPVGKVTAIVGTSGSGKTTVLKLLQQFYTDFSGEILIGSYNLMDIPPAAWRRNVGSVMQEGYIFSDTIARNIAISDEVIDEQKLHHAATVANISDFIQGLPLRYESKIGAEGSGVSAGQRQRILIARAVYKNPGIILFDEATNSLDANNEMQIMDNLHAVFRDKTVIIVAHRLSTVKNADHIIVLENGRVMEEGNHYSLLSLQGRYRELVHNQLQMQEENTLVN